jgi:hypothetical protein
MINGEKLPLLTANEFISLLCHSISLNHINRIFNDI